ncbi:MAG: MBL fold metallo-hydrolase [Lachnospiraceae bacterium]|nr:MBL fold metallo-hydrolase [Lachnospiraceae bacterium]
MENQLYIKQLRPYLYLMDEAHEATGYLLIGEEKACVIDTMNGYNNLYKAVREITDKPVFVINTHGHGDHIFGNVYFDEAYINPNDIPMTEMFVKHPDFIKFCEENGVSMPSFKPIKGGDIIDLGGKTLEIYDIPGHSPGGILLLLKEDRILFTGDSINHHLWMMLDDCSNMDEYVRTLDKVMFLENEANLILHGHARDYDDISLMRCLRRGAVEICEGKTENDEPYNWFGGVCKQHHFALEPGKHYSQEHSVICYRPEQGRVLRQ